MLRIALIDRCCTGEPYVSLAPRAGNARISIVVQPNRSTGAPSGGDAPIPVADFDELLASHSADFDAVVFPSGSLFDIGQFRRAAAAGKHLLYDSPTGVTFDALETARSAAGTAGVRWVVGHALRFSPSVRAIKESLDAGRLGAAGLLRLHCWIPCQHNADEISGLPYDPIVREIDLACWLFARRPTTVYAVGRADANPVDRRPARDLPLTAHPYIQLHLGFPEGGMALLDWSAGLPAGDGYLSISLIGSAGAAYADDHHNQQLVFGGGHPTAIRTGEGDLAVLGQLREFVAAIEGRGTKATPEFDCTALEVAEAAARSFADGRAVLLAEGARA